MKVKYSIPEDIQCEDRSNVENNIPIYVNATMTGNESATAIQYQRQKRKLSRHLH